MTTRLSINLADMQNKEDELLKKEMKHVYSGASGEDCQCIYTPLGSDNLDTMEASAYQGCTCGSIFVIFGLAFTSEQ